MSALGWTEAVAEALREAGAQAEVLGPLRLRWSRGEESGAAWLGTPHQQGQPPALAAQRLLQPRVPSPAAPLLPLLQSEERLLRRWAVDPPGERCPARLLAGRRWMVYAEELPGGDLRLCSRRRADLLGLSDEALHQRALEALRRRLPWRVEGDEGPLLRLHLQGWAEASLLALPELHAALPEGALLASPAPDLLLCAPREADRGALVARVEELLPQLQGALDGELLRRGPKGWGPAGARGA